MEDKADGSNTSYEAECGEPSVYINTGDQDVKITDPYDPFIIGYYGNASYIDNLVVGVNVATRDGWGDTIERHVYWNLLGQPTSLTSEEQTKSLSVTSGANNGILKNTGIYFLVPVVSKANPTENTLNEQLMFLKYCAPVVLGCIDPAAFNYDPKANENDGKCQPKVTGCMDRAAFNYDPSANTSGTCVPKVNGCTLSDAVNYDPSANTNDGTCVAKVKGCTISGAINFNPDANTYDGSCLFSETIPVTGGGTGGAGGAVIPLIIPVTGVNLGEQLQSVAKYLGLLVIGMTLLLEGFLKKHQDKWS